MKVAVKKMAPKKDSAVKDEAVVEARTVDETSEENLRERRYLWTARAAAVVAVGSFCTNIILLIALFNLSPLVRTNPFFLTFQNKNAQVVTIEKPDIGESILPTITENMIRQYLVARNDIPADTTELAARWSAEGPVRWMSSDAVFAAFRSEVQSVLQRIEANHLTRQVKIASVLKQQTDYRGVELWVASITLTEMSDDSPQPRETHWTVVLQIAYQPRDVIWADRLKNPLGFKVRDYTMQRQDAV